MTDTQGATSETGDLPTWSLPEVDPVRMHVMALLLGDPNVIHVDAEAVRALGLGDAPINQGPTNIGYLYNLLAQAYPGGQVTALKTRLLANVFAGDSVTAHGRETAVTGNVRTCSVWLTSGGTTVLDGTATVRVATAT
ncbi:MAG TPA: MaoC/PaaZ C-terminal domain-containing protein [Jatrophihabitantaceae bacterium]|jgi:acyl dehydratase